MLKFASFQISYIVPNHLHPQENKEYHYLLLHLKKPLNLTTPYTRSVCLFELIFEPVDLENWVGWKTYFTGFTSPPRPDGSLVPKFLTLEITRGSYDLCNSAFNYHYGRQPDHEYCLRLTAGKHVLFQYSEFKRMHCCFVVRVSYIALYKSGSGLGLLAVSKLGPEAKYV